MNDMKRMCEIIEIELDKIAEKGLTSGNLDTAYKLIDMMKDIKNVEYWDTKGEYYDIVKDEMRGGYSESDGYSRDGGYSQARGYSHGGRRRDSMGRYSRNSYGDGMDGRSMRGYSRNGGGDPYDEYMTTKQSYRSGEKSPECKQRMIGALEEHLDGLTEEIAMLGRDADCAEEKNTIMRYIDKLKRMM